MLSDIENRHDIEVLVQCFYKKATADELIGHFFGHVNWERHLPIMYNFWENIVFYTGNYEGNPMRQHQAVHRFQPFTAEHFERWVGLFEATIDELFVGERAELIKQRARSIATIMQLKTVGENTLLV